MIATCVEILLGFEIDSILFQELVLQLESRTHVERIQIMSNLNMVATCVEILLGEEPGYQDDPDFKKAKFMSVGQVKFQNPSKR